MASGIKVTIGANTNPFAKGLRRVSNRISRWASRLPGRFARAGIAAGRRFAGGLIRTVKRGLLGAGALGAALIGKSISEAGRFEKYDLQFEALLGSATAAKKRMDEIKKVDLEAPFDITSITDASRVLTVFTGNAFAGTKALKMMADAASVTPNDIKDVAFWYGRAYSMIQSGRPFGEAAMRLQEMGLITGKARNEMERFSGVKNPRAIKRSLDILNEEFLKFQGSAAKLAKTWPGIMSIFTSASKQAFAKVGDAILPMAKTWLVELIDKLTELRNNGTLTAWGEGVAKAAKRARAEIEKLAPKVQGAISKIKDAFENEKLGEYIGSKIEPAIENALEKIGSAIKKHGPDFVNFGMEIGGSILRGMDKALDKAPFWLRLITGDPIRDLMDVSGKVGTTAMETKISKESNRQKNIELGQRIIRQMGRNPDAKFSPKWADDMWAIQMASKAYSDPAWAKDLFNKPLPVQLVNTKEDIP